MHHRRPASLERQTRLPRMMRDAGHILQLAAQTLEARSLGWPTTSIYLRALFVSLHVTRGPFESHWPPTRTIPARVCGDAHLPTGSTLGMSHGVRHEALRVVRGGFTRVQSPPRIWIPARGGNYNTPARHIRPHVMGRTQDT